MKNPSRTAPVMEFVFQTIPLDQVADLIPHTYRSKYEAIRNQVIERIKAMPGDETFLFQPLNRKAILTDDLIARICHGINTGLVREQLDWKVSFSVKAKAFVVTPFKRYKISKHTGSKTAKTPEVKFDTPEVPSDSDITKAEADHIAKLLYLTQKHYGKTLLDLKRKLIGEKRDPELINLKRAFLYVGRNAMGIKLSHLGRLLGLTSGATTPLCQEAMKNAGAKQYVKVLSEAITHNGRGN